MKPWNPYAMTLHGQPIVGQTPPKLVVYGPPLTARQGAMLQTAYNAFVGAARVSIVPNPSRQGRLTDGSPYTIECSGASCTCTVWTATTENANRALSGILFLPERTLLVNSGKLNAPEAKWELKNIGPMELSQNYARNLPRTQYNQFAFLTVSVFVPGEGKYVYAQQELMARYGNLFGYLVAAGVIANISGDGRISVVGLDGIDLKIKRSEPQRISQLFPKYGAPPPDPTKEIPFTAAEVLFTGGTYKKVVGSPLASKSGMLVAFRTNEIVPIDAAAERKKSYVLIDIASHYFGGFSGGRLSTVLSSASITFISRDSTDKVMESSMSGGVFKAPITAYTLPKSTVFPPGRLNASPPSKPDELTVGPMRSSMTVESWADPVVKISSISWYVDSSGYDRYNVVHSGVGLRSRVWTREESLFGFVSVDYVGGGKLAVVTFNDTFSYRDAGSGDYSYRGVSNDQLWNPNDPKPPKPKVGDEGYGGATSTEESLDFTGDITLQSGRTITLADGSKLVANMLEYTEHSSGAWAKAHSSGKESEDTNNSYSYTLKKEQRRLLLHDPALRLLCYTEVKSSVSSNGSLTYIWDEKGIKTNISSGGVALPSPPTPQLIIKCAGRTITFDLPFFPGSAVTDADRRSYLLCLFSNTGIAPGLAANTAAMPHPETGTSDGFYKLDRASWYLHAKPWDYTGSYTTEGSIAAASIYQDNKGTTIQDTNTFRGLSPSITHPIPVVTYTKTPETGGGFMTIYLKEGDFTLLKRYVVDLSGIREAESVVSGLPPPSLTYGSYPAGTPF